MQGKMEPRVARRLDSEGNHVPEVATYSTKDLALASYLQLAVPGGVIRRYEWKGSSCTFVFYDTDELQHAIEIYNHGLATVEPREFVIECSRVKREMFRVQALDKDGFILDQ